MHFVDTLAMRLKRYEQIRELIERRRRELGLSQEALAARIGVSQSTMSGKLNGTTGMTYDEVMTLVEFLGLDNQITEDLKIRPGAADESERPIRWDDRHSALQVIAEGLDELSSDDRHDLYFLLALFFQHRTSQPPIARTLRELSGR